MKHGRLAVGCTAIVLAALVVSDRNAVTNLPPPGLNRLNRTEYANVIRDFLAFEVDAAKFLPSDDSTQGFDSMAGTLVMSPRALIRRGRCHHVNCCGHR